MLKKFLTVTSLLCCSLVASATAKYLVVEQQSGEKIDFLLKDKPVITYESGDLVVNGSATTSYAISSVKNYHFSETGQDGVENIVADMPLISSIDDATLRVENASANVKVSLVAVTGAVLASTVTDQNGAAVVSLPSQKGVYVLVIGKNSIKVVRK